MPSRSWRFHAGRAFLLIVALLVAGLLIGYPLLVLGLAAVVFVGWQSFNLWKLHQWTRNPVEDIPQSVGLWADIYDGISTLAMRNRRQRQKYRTMITEFQSLTNAFPDATLAIDENDVLTWFNHAAESLLDLRNPGDLGQPITNLLRDPDFANWLAVQDEVRSPLEMPCPRGEQRWLTVNAVMFRDRQRLVVLRDTTAVQNVEKIRRDFVANISHELRTPLTVVQGYLELLEQHPADDVAQAVDKMLNQTGHMQSLLDDLLELSRVQSAETSGNEEIVNVGAMLMQLKEQAEELSRGQHDIQFEIDQDLHLGGVAADLESAFGNLISNAVKYTPEGGAIRISWENSPEGPRYQVVDEGVGIPAREIPRITERFYRVGADRGRQTGGTGLGLAIVKHVLNAHQADLTISSELGEGSTFTATFPADRARVEVEGAANENYPEIEPRL